MVYHRGTAARVRGAQKPQLSRGPRILSPALKTYKGESEAALETATETGLGTETRGKGAHQKKSGEPRKVKFEQRMG